MMKMSDAVGFMTIYPTIKKNKCKISTMYKLTRSFEICEKESSFYREKLVEILNNYGEKDSSGVFITVDGNIKIRPGAEQECQSAINELLGIDINFNEDYKLSIAEIQDWDLDWDQFQLISHFIKD